MKILRKTIDRRLKSILEAIQREQLTIVIGRATLKWITVLAISILIWLITLATFSCGESNTPSQTVDEYYRLMLEKNDCQKVADLITDNKPKLTETYINDCKQIALVSYSIKGETIDGTGIFAKVDVNITIMENGKQIINHPTRFLVKRGDVWKLTEIE